MTLAGKISFSQGASDPNFSATLAADNGAGDYFEYDYVNKASFSGTLFGSIWKKDPAPPLNGAVKPILTFTSPNNTIVIAQDHTPTNSFEIIISLNGAEFVTPVIPATTEWKWFYFWIDFENDTGFFYLDNVRIDFATTPGAQVITTEDVDTVRFIENATFSDGHRFGRLFVDVDSTISSDEFEGFRRQFARIDTVIAPRNLGQFGQLGTGNAPLAYLRLRDQVFLDSRGEPLVNVGTNNIDFDNASPILIVP